MGHPSVPKSGRWYLNLSGTSNGWKNDASGSAGVGAILSDESTRSLSDPLPHILRFASVYIGNVTMDVAELTALSIGLTMSVSFLQLDLPNISPGQVNLSIYVDPQSPIQSLSILSPSYDSETVICPSFRL